MNSTATVRDRHAVEVVAKRHPHAQSPGSRPETMISYEANLDDVTEPSVRFYLRSKTSRNAKVRSTMVGAVLCAVAFLYIFRRREPEILAVAGIAGLLVGGLINYFYYIPTVRGRILKHMKNTVGGKLPSLTTYEIENGKLVCDSLGVTISFPLSSLEAVTEDTERMEISFGESGLCTIPLRAFQTDAQKAAFVGKLNSAHSG